MPPCLRKFYTLLPNNAQFKHLLVENAKGPEIMHFEITKCKLLLGKGLPAYNIQKSGPGNVRAYIV